MIDKDRIFANGALPSETVEMPAWGGAVTVKGISANQRDTIDLETNELKEKGAAPNIRGRLIAATVCNGDGERLFTDDDASRIGELPAATIEPLFEVATRLGGITATDVQDLEKNSQTAHAADSS